MKSNQPRKMSEVIKEMSEVLLRHPSQPRSAEAAHASALFANIAWNECVGMDCDRDGYRNLWETFEAENPELRNEFKSNDIPGMIDELVRYKQQYFSDDMRRILTCGIPEGRLRVEWVPPATPGIDTHDEMQLYGLVRIGKQDEAIRFAQHKFQYSLKVAQQMVAKIQSDLGNR